MVTDVTKIILHIGTEKTGSTSIQSNLKANRKLLLKREIWYSKRLGNLLWQLVRWPQRYSQARPHIEKILETAAVYDTILCSAERLHSRLKSRELIEDLKILLEKFGLDPTLVIVYLRNPADIANSMASTAAQHNKSLQQEPLSPYLDLICDHRSTMKNWAGVFGGSVVTPRVFESSSFIAGSLTTDFLAAAGIPDYEDFVQLPRANAQISHTGITVMDHVNDVLARDHTYLNKEDLSRLRQFVYRNLVEPFFNSPRYSQPDYVWRYYDRAFADSNEWVRQEYFPGRPTLFNPKTPPPATQPEISDEGAAVVAASLVSAAVALQENSGNQ